MEEVNLVPIEILFLIPSFDGDENALDSFINKCDYVVTHFRGKASDAQNLYLLHCVTSKLKGKAASFVNQRNDLKNWDQLKELLTERFGDSRSEHCLVTELSSLLIQENESYKDFYYRVETLKHKILSKISTSPLAESKNQFYEEMALHSFLSNLPSHYLQIVRMKNADTFHKVLKVVIDEENFYNEHKHRKKNPPTPRFTNQVGHTGGYRPGGPLFGSTQAVGFGSSQPSSFGSTQAVGFGSSQPSSFGSTQTASASSIFGVSQNRPSGNSGQTQPTELKILPDSLKTKTPAVDTLPTESPKIWFNNNTKSFKNTVTNSVDVLKN